MISELEEQLENNTTARYKGALVRAKANIYRQTLEEKPSKEFLRIEQSIQHNNEITRIIDTQGDEQKTQEGITNAFVNFYTHLYAKEDTNRQAEGSPQRDVCSPSNLITNGSMFYPRGPLQ